MKLGSLFDGVGGFPLAGLRCGFIPVWASEIEPFPIKVTQHHFPNMNHLGDITKINGAEIESVNTIAFGSPCTRLSVAGRHDGFDITFECQGTKEEPHKIYANNIRTTDKYQYIYKNICPICGKELIETNESALFFHAIRIINEMREATNGTYPRFIVWENVPGAYSSNGGQDFRAVLEEIAEAEIPMPESGKWAEAGMVRTEQIDIAWRTLDAQYWGVPQRRKRIFLVADFAGQCAGEILFKSESLRGNYRESREAGEETAGDVGSGVKKSVFYESGPGWFSEGFGCLRCEGENRPSRPAHTIVEPSFMKLKDMTCEDLQSYCPTELYKDLRLCEGKRCEEAYKNYLLEVQLYDMSHADEVMRPVEAGIAPTLNSRMGTGGNQVPVILAFNGRQDPVSGLIAGSLDCCHPQAQCVAYPEPANTLKAKANMSFRDDSDNVVVLINCRNLCENEELSGTLQHKESGGYSLNYQNPVRVGYAVRRLTPLECERLQGFPDGWTDILGASDTGRYKALGNSVAIPCVEFVLGGIARVS